MCKYMKSDFHKKEIFLVNITFHTTNLFIVLIMIKKSNKFQIINGTLIDIIMRY